MFENPVVIEVEVRSVFGIDKIYPANEPAAKLARIAGTKTLKKADLENAKALGIKVVEITKKKLTALACAGAIVFGDVPVADVFYGS